MRCSNCNNIILEGESFCRKCGQQVEGVAGFSNFYPSVPEEFKKEDIYQGSPESRNPNIKQEEQKIYPAPSNKFKKIWRALKIVILLFLVVLGSYLAFNFFKDNPLLSRFFGNSKKPKFPALERAKTVDFNWEYQKQPYSLKITVYGSVDDYYGSLPKGLEKNKEDESVNEYLNIPSEDKSISEITTSIKNLSTNRKLKDDQTLELATAFVQSIPYDEEQAKTDQFHPRYPYEVIYDKKGICSDKSILMIAILRDMGYGNSAFLYDSESHMAAGVSCPKTYSTSTSGYCIIETTATGWRIGVVPEIKSNNRAAERSTIENYNSKSSSPTNKKLTTPRIVAKISGTEYKGIVETIKIENEIKQLLDYFPIKKAVIEKEQVELLRLEEQLDDYKSTGNISSYNNLVPKYNSQLRKVNSDIDEYNSKVERYNKLIQEY